MPHATARCGCDLDPPMCCSMKPTGFKVAFHPASSQRQVRYSEAWESLVKISLPVVTGWGRGKASLRSDEECLDSELPSRCGLRSGTSALWTNGNGGVRIPCYGRFGVSWEIQQILLSVTCESADFPFPRPTMSRGVWMGKLRKCAGHQIGI